MCTGGRFLPFCFEPDLLGRYIKNADIRKNIMNNIDGAEG
jgi:hypothetical protein